MTTQLVPNLSRITMRGVMRSEWTKIRSVRSNMVTLAAAAGILLCIGLIFSAMVGGVIGSTQTDVEGDTIGAALAGIQVAQLIIGVLGVLVITSEYSTGMIRTSLTSVPSRIPVFGAKVVVLAVTTLVALGASAFVAFFAGQALIASGDIATASLGDPGVLRAVIGSAVFLAGTALMGLAVGALLRSTAGAISVLFGVIFLLPALGTIMLPAGSRDDVLQYLPSIAGSSFTSVAPEASILSPAAGAAVFAAWVVVPLLAAAVAFKRRAA
ncbi:ABC transporter permease subunit [Aeromicrobium chenweiae]|uniref:ABC transporter permease n=1 Tax=Aeromicrobium chenweiae TaxID=2079793 RepID=A0A2S0WLI6_9ACTN|nr:ABC transporter permease subunit [Aeromicrobium chenweiae]AWB92134.1 ABC transporter permease [Aeromicrobium chenweiae]TGN32985.1 ABC transporter permease [Aeromicrobium chenweiae]